ncbi:MAG TPA: PP2C family serine/threonine-protein phosphatase [Gemmatirosa sp.]|nr:PP2C family serine/threonine-protein phosphatase [Gemmatirosa sp.]
MTDAPVAAGRPARAAAGGWRVLAASVQGTGHATRGQPCQDSCAFHITRDGVLVAAACDGAGSAPLSAAGADVAARTAVSSCVDALVATSGRDGARGEHWWTQRLRCAAGTARDAVRHEAARRDVDPCDLATTLLLVLATAERVASLQIGDGAVVASGVDDAVVGVTTPERGEYINETSFLTSAGAVEAARVGEWRGPVAHVALTTDGLQVVALDLASGMPHAPFFRPLFAHVRHAADLDTAAGDLATWLASPRLTARTDDDLTLVLASRVPGAGARRRRRRAG